MMKTLALSILTLGMMSIATYQEIKGLEPDLIYLGILLAFFGAIYADDETPSCACECQRNDTPRKD